MAQADFTAPVYLSQAGDDAFVPQVDSDANGDAIAVWRRDDGTSSQIQSRRVSAAGLRGPLKLLSGGGEDAFHPNVRVDADGDAIAGWRRLKGANHRIQARTISASGVLGETLTLSGAGQDAFDYGLAIDDAGDAIAVWRRSDGTNHRIQARTISAAGALGPTKTISAGGADARDPEVAVDAGGDALVVWRRFDGTSHRLQARRVSASSALGPIETLSAPALNATRPQVGVDTDGDAVAAWRAADGERSWIEARTISSAGAVGPTVDLSSEGDPTGNADLPALAVDGEGDAIVAWTRPRDGGTIRIHARTLSATGILGAKLSIAGNGQSPTFPRLATDADGDTVVVWTRLIDGSTRIQSRTISATGVVGPTDTLSGKGQNGLNPRPAMDAGGEAVVLWERSDGVSSRIQAARGP